MASVRENRYWHENTITTCKRGWYYQSAVPGPVLI